ncbi:MAG: hypothetical protein LBK67_07735 [Coriobacteriales bacterium]|jgi:Tfp pilus assembly protein PilE|nr:hypothetical protein [Coriobacteriales bacterium]
MATRKATTTRAFFLELILDFVIFAICAIICLLVFAEARTESVRSAALSQLGVEAQEVAELFRLESGNTTSITTSIAALPNAQQDGDTITWYYDRELSLTTEDEAYFVLACVIDESQPVRRAHITLDEGEMRLFTYDVSSWSKGAEQSEAGGGGS